MQAQPVSGCGDADVCVAGALQRCEDVVPRPLAAADFDQRADDAPTHPVEESIGFDDKGDFRTAGADIAADQSADGFTRRSVAFHSERAKIVPAQQAPGRLAYCRDVQRLRHMPCVPDAQRIHHRMISDLIAVFFGNRMKSSME